MLGYFFSKGEPYKLLVLGIVSFVQKKRYSKCCSKKEKGIVSFVDKNPTSNMKFVEEIERSSW